MLPSQCSVCWNLWGNVTVFRHMSHLNLTNTLQCHLSILQQSLQPWLLEQLWAPLDSPLQLAFLQWFIFWANRGYPTDCFYVLSLPRKSSCNNWHSCELFSAVPPACISRGKVVFWASQILLFLMIMLTACKKAIFNGLHYVYQWNCRLHWFGEEERKFCLKWQVH